MSLGASWLGRGPDGGDGATRFLVWAPKHERVWVRLLDPPERVLPLEPLADGYHGGVVEGVTPGARYLYRLGEGGPERPDPASRAQPEGVHGPSQVVAPDPGFSGPDDGWRGLAPEGQVLYELHVPTFTPAGTCQAVIPHLDQLVELGVTALSLMPAAQCPGARNWGYDGVYPFAVQHSHGGRAGLASLVEACHRRGLGVLMDVVMNHLGPEGNYLAEYGPYFTDAYRTPWGSAVNFDGPGSDEVRRYWLECALQWLVDFRCDGLRLDAVHAIHDETARPFLEELAAAVHARGESLGRRLILVAESDQNDPRLLHPPERGGFGLDAQWSDDLHHALHALLTGEQRGYYADYGRPEQVACALARGFVYAGEHSRGRGRRHGRALVHAAPRQLVVALQNHDQVGNRAQGDRIDALVSFEARKLASAAVLLSPFTPLLFMGEEWGAPEPFQYFTSHGDPALVEAVRRGRREEFKGFAWAGEVPDPQDEATLRRSTLDHARAREEPHRTLRQLYRLLLALRGELRARLGEPGFAHLEAQADAAGTVVFRRRATRPDAGQAVLVLALAGPEAPGEGSPARELALELAPGRWQVRLDTAHERWRGPGSPEGPGSAVPEWFEVTPGAPALLRLRPNQALLLLPAGGAQEAS